MPEVDRSAFPTVARFLITAWLLPGLLGFVVYYGFTSAYTRGVFSEEGFRTQYSGGVFRYRVLGPWLQHATHDAIEASGLELAGPRGLRRLHPRATPNFYAAYFVHNTLLVCLACSVLFLVIARSPLPAFSGDQLLFALAALMSLTQYAVVPYDALAYLWLALAIGIAAKPPSLAGAAALAAVTFAATLTRETAVFIPAFYFVVHRRAILSDAGLSPARIALVASAAAFAATYVGLRVVFGFDADLRVLLAHNLTTGRGLAGIAFVASFAGLALASPQQRRDCAWFLAATSPYVVSTVVLATTWEIRLWMPVILCLLVLKSGVVRSDASDGLRPADAR